MVTTADEAAGGIPRAHNSIFKKGLVQFAVNGALPVIDGAPRSTSKPFKAWSMMKPNARSKYWGWTHYGVFVPSLPGPLRYLSVMILVGLPAVGIFDHDEFVGSGESAATANAKRLTTLLATTADPSHHHYRGYDADADCSLPQDDGAPLRWGRGSDLVVEFPGGTEKSEGKVVKVRGAFEGWAFDLTLDVDPVAAWFIDTAFYQHVSLGARVRGTVAGVEVDTTGAWDYARAWSTQSFSSKPVSVALRMPADFFTYHVLALGGDRQLLIGEVGAAGIRGIRFAFLRKVGEGKVEFFNKNAVEIKVVKYSSTPLVDSLGRSTRNPEAFELRIRQKDVAVAEIRGDVDAPWKEGHGKGWVSAYTFKGQVKGESVQGNAYLEWIDLS